MKYPVGTVILIATLCSCHSVRSTSSDSDSGSDSVSHSELSTDSSTTFDTSESTDTFSMDSESDTGIDSNSDNSDSETEDLVEVNLCEECEIGSMNLDNCPDGMNCFGFVVDNDTRPRCSYNSVSDEQEVCPPEFDEENIGSSCYNPFLGCFYDRLDWQLVEEIEMMDHYCTCECTGNWHCVPAIWE